MTDPNDPVPAFAVSPTDQSSDRAQSDDNNTVAVASQVSASGERAAARSQAETDQAITVDLLDRLIVASDRQTASNEDLALAAVEYQERARLARKRFRLTILALIVGTAVILVALVVILSKMNQNLDSAAKSRAQLADCIKLTGKCYKEGQARTGAVVGTVNQVSVLAAACAPAYVDLPLDARITAIQTCIEKHLPR